MVFHVHGCCVSINVHFNPFFLINSGSDKLVQFSSVINIKDEIINLLVAILVSICLLFAYHVLVSSSDLHETSNCLTRAGDGDLQLLLHDPKTH